MSSKYPNSGALFKNKRKTTDKHPDMTGTIEIGEDLLRELLAQAKAGKDIKVDVSAWSKATKAGDKFLSLQVKKAWEKQEGRSSGWSKGLDDDVPF